ncbi:hypothetical protein ABHN84_20755 [Shewanella vesiculosa]|uniref:Replication protein n=1 Tax=Shewanella vesiculosa TaxID=518738 RepID=A0ABV0FV32_9GAMM
MTETGLEMSSEMVLKKSAEITISELNVEPTKKPASPALIRIIERSIAAGEDGQPVYTTNGYSKPLFIDTKKGKNSIRETQIPKRPGMGRRYYSRKLETAFLVLKDIVQVRENQATIVFVTVNFDYKFRDALNKHSEPAQKFGKLIREAGWVEPSIAVLECGINSPKMFTHAHVITITRQSKQSNESRLKSIIGAYGDNSNSAVSILSDYLTKQPYTELIELEEEQFGSLPIDENIDHPYWQGAWREPGSSSVKRRVPVNIASSDYLSKELGTKQDKKTYSLPGFGNLLGLKNKERAKITSTFKKKYKSTNK